MKSNAYWNSTDFPNGNLSDPWNPALRILRYRRTLMTVGLILAIAAVDRLSAQVASADGQSSPAFMEKMRHWQDEMSKKFSDTFNSLRDEKAEAGKSIAMASVDLREKDDAYVLRLNLPDRDLTQVTVTLEGSRLSIEAPATQRAPGYQQTLVLSRIADNVKPVIERKAEDNLMIVTVPKTTGKTAEQDHGRMSGESPAEGWDREMLERMDRMHEEMNRIFKDAYQDIRTLPGHMGGIFDEPRFGSSLVLRDEGGEYVVRAYLPDRNLKDLNVAVEGKVLKIEAKAETVAEQKDKGVMSSHKAAYAQTLTLPGPVVSEKMRIDRKDGMVVVTLPKASVAE